MKTERISEIPTSLRSVIVATESLAKKIDEERLASYVLLEETIYPKHIRRLSEMDNSGEGLASPYGIWEDVSLNSGILDLFFNIEHINFLNDKQGMRDKYHASVVSVEMLPSGILILRGKTVVSRSLFMPDEWRKSKRAQFDAFTKVLNDPKDTLFDVDVSMPPVYD